MDPFKPSPQPSAGSTALGRGAGGAMPRELVFPSLSQGDQALAVLLINRGLLSVESARAAQVYCDEHNRDLRQSILELNLISPDVLNQLAFERLSALATDNGDSSAPGTGVGGRGGAVSPDRTQHHRDVRKELQEKAQTATLSELVNQILERACDCEATDIHFDPQESGLRVRFRIDGQLQDILFIEPAMATPVVSRIKIISNLNIVERKHSQDGRITIQHHNRPRDLRVATFPTIFGEKIVIRIHEVLTDVSGFAHLGMSKEQAEILDKLICNAVWRGAGRRAGRVRQDFDALQLPGAHQLSAQERDDDRRPDRAPHSGHQPDAESTTRASSASAKACGRCSARTPTSS